MEQLDGLVSLIAQEGQPVSSVRDSISKLIGTSNPVLAERISVGPKDRKFDLSAKQKEAVLGLFSRKTFSNELMLKFLDELAKTFAEERGISVKAMRKAIALTIQEEYPVLSRLFQMDPKKWPKQPSVNRRSKDARLKYGRVGKFKRSRRPM